MNRRLTWENGLFPRRMPACGNPLTSHHHCDHVVESKRYDGRTTAGRASDDLGAVFAPFEMLGPFPQPRIKQSYLLSTERIARALECPSLWQSFLMFRE
jgi:hypothetical protein